MNIIFGDAANFVPDNFTKLELDTIGVAGKTFVAYCVVEQIPLHEFPRVEHNKSLHTKLIQEYKNRNWDFCADAIDNLKGAWGGEVDTFYEELLNRINHYKLQPPSQDWTGVVDRSQ